MNKAAPFDFVFDYLPRNIVVKPMFGMFYIYLNKKLMLMLREAVKEPEMNGIWVSSHKKHHQSLVEEIPGLAEYVMYDGDKKYESHWRLLKPDDDDFESSAIYVCELISKGDKRIGKETKKAPTE
ncbi:MAG: hypothetical protein ACHQHN_00835 [Sphingobacteriales bacterium]